MALEHELAVFRARLPELLGPGDVHEGKWVVIKGDDARWPCADFDAALADGYERHGVTDFLVKQIERVETVHHFSRDLGPRPASAADHADLAAEVARLAAINAELLTACESVLRMFRDVGGFALNDYLGTRETIRKLVADARKAGDSKGG